MLMDSGRFARRFYHLLLILVVASAGRIALGSRWYIVWKARLVDATDDATVHGESGWDDAAVAWKKEISISPGGGGVMLAPFDSYGPYPLHLDWVSE